MPELIFGANVKRRWVWNNGLHFKFSIGYTFKSRNVSSDTTGFDKRLDSSKDEYNFSNLFLGELSIGYAF